MTTLTDRDLAALAEFDTPTICNALELVAPDRRALGFNRRPLVCPFPGMKPVVAYARTATIRSREPQQCAAAESESFLERVFGGSLKPMLAYFVEQRRITKKDLRELSDQLEGKTTKAPSRKRRSS